MMLKNMFRLIKKGKKGFSLAELMVVVAIIGVLVVIAIPVYNASTKKAEKGACIANLRMIDGAIQQYINNEDENPEELTDLDDYFQGGAPKCPSEGTYTIVNIDGHLRVKCSIEGHEYNVSDSDSGDESDGK